MTHPASAGTFLIAEPETHSTPDMVKAVAAALGVRSRIFSVPVGLLRACAAAVGKQREFAKFCGSLEVSADKARQLLAWRPRVSFTDGIALAAAAYRSERHHG
jgi:UDP-glucose 4-epimerase